MFDTNAYDKLLENIVDWDAFERKSINRFEYYITSIQIDEMENISDNQKEKKISLRQLREQFQQKKVPALMILGSARLGECFLPDDNVTDVYNSLQKGKDKYINDANIGATAYNERCIVVTNDTTFTKHLKRINQDVLSFEEWWVLFNSCN